MAVTETNNQPDQIVDINKAAYEKMLEEGKLNDRVGKTLIFVDGRLVISETDKQKAYFLLDDSYAEQPYFEVTL